MAGIIQAYLRYSEGGHFEARSLAFHFFHLGSHATKDETGKPWKGSARSRELSGRVVNGGRLLISNPDR